MEHLFFDGLRTLLQRAVHARAELQFQDDRPAGYRTYIYLNLWSDIDPTDMANRIRQAMYDADFWMLEESDKGYNQPAYDPATRTYTVQWTWVYWQEAL